MLKGYREDIVIEKGIVVTEDHAIKMEKTISEIL